ncbi:MAG: hypothetical protein HYZ42_05145 [Bacteroidetes bacterium]|nr:hypothetical protein [Bacteroidota bacterium]
MKFDFKKYHYRGMNAATAEEKAAINQELKDLYAGLSEEDQKIFNDELQHFMIHEFANLSNSFESVKDTKAE